jgi:hypothetical protein
MAGHLDDVRGRPAVFWRLDELKTGDEIVVHYSDDSEQRFAVMTVEDYEASSAPLERIFGIDFERDLNLITCDGQWNAQSNLYERRLVVYARLIREATASPATLPATLPAAGVIIEDATQTSTPSARTRAPSPRAGYARQDRGQPFAPY